ncbi:basic region leucine zipper domain-containing protein [Ditylenchus destructor]|nr:basic region leucine zipper domain-containing protein [Ditylenchus destructor]
MAAPFSGEDLVKRSILSSILGLKVKTPKFQQQQPGTSRDNHWASGVNHDQPCSSKSVLRVDTSRNVAVINHKHSVTQTPANANAPQNYNLTEIECREQSLSEQLADGLFLASPQAHFADESYSNPSPAHIYQQSPQDIYREIVCECEHLELQTPQEQNYQHFNFDSTDMAKFAQMTSVNSPAINPIKETSSQITHGQMYNSRDSHPQMRTEPQFINQPNFAPIGPTICMHCHHTIPPRIASNLPIVRHPSQYNQVNNQQILLDQHEDIESLIPTVTSLYEQQKGAQLGHISLEEFIKMVVLAVKEAGGFGKNSKGKPETPEEILQRKRQQNNEAAARYRKRQREAKMQEESETQSLLRRNSLLKQEIVEIQKQIDLLKTKFVLDIPYTPENQLWEACAVNCDHPHSSKSIVLHDNSYRHFSTSEGNLVKTLEYLPNCHLSDFNCQKRSLSGHLANNLFHVSSEFSFNSSITANQQIEPALKSPDDIYREIVCECKHLEQHSCQHPHDYCTGADPKAFTNYMSGNNSAYNHTDVIPSQHIQPYPLASSEHELVNLRNVSVMTPTVFEQRNHAIHPKIASSLPVLEADILYAQVNNQATPLNQQDDTKSPLSSVGSLNGKQLGNISLEELVKMVVVAVKETESLNKNTKEKTEMHDELNMLERKRKQNKAAAARYRRKKREARKREGSEMQEQLRRNSILKHEIEEVQEQINLYKAKFMRCISLFHAG